MSKAVICHIRSPPGHAQPAKSPDIQVGGRAVAVDTRPPPPLEWRLIDRSLIYRWPPEAPVRCDVHYSLLASPTVALEVAVMQPRVKIS